MNLDKHSSERDALVLAPAVGCGNFLRTALALSSDAGAKKIFLDEPFTARSGEAISSVSLAELDALANAEAAAYFAAGVRPSDPVAISLDDGFGYLVHFIALTRLGAIPAMVNPNMRADLAAGFVGRVGAVGLIASDDRLRAMSTHLPPVLRFAASVLPAGAHVPADHIFAPDDPVLLCHSSGTTGIPKAVSFLHHAFFHGIRERLKESAPPSRLLSALPHSHSAGLAFPMLALLRDEPVMLVKGDDAARVLAAVERFRATAVVAFPYTFVDIAESADLAARFDLSTLRSWINTGDAAHGRHVQKLTSLGGAEGSSFIDGLGSSEMGFSLFRIVHSKGTRHPARAVGAPLPFVDAVVLDPNGQQLGPGVVGRLGVRAPTLTGGYWNDSVLTARSRVGGYWITGDLVMRDEAGRFTHVDRISDVIETEAGAVYSLLTEELLLDADTDLVDVTVFGVPGALTAQRAVALVRPTESARHDARVWLTRLNDVLRREGRALLSDVWVPEFWSDVPVGPTGKVRKTALRERFASASSARGAP